MRHDLKTLQTLIDRLVERGERSALLAMQKEGLVCWSYRRLGQTASRLAFGLARKGIGPGDRVLLLAENRPAWLAAALAVLKAGAVVLPLDVQLGDESLAHILKDSEPRLAFTTSSQADRLDQTANGRLQLVLLDGADDDERNWQRLLQAEPTELPRVDPADPAALFYTSGTTGPSKGVPLSHANLAFQVNTVQATGVVTEEDRVLLPLPLHHVYPFVVGMLVVLGLGLPLIMPESLTGPQILRALQEGKVTAIIGVPRLYRALYEGIISRAQSRGRLAGWMFTRLLATSTWLRRRFSLQIGKRLLAPLHRQFGPDLRLLASGGSALDPELAWRLEGLGWQVAIGYGLTETAPLLAINLPGSNRLESVGRPVPGVEIRIRPTAVNGDSGPAATQASPEQSGLGEIQARGPNVFAGYRHLPEKSAEAFTEDGWFRTGDLGLLDDSGYLQVQGRLSTLIVTESGKNIQPDEVEEVYGSHPAIREIGILQEKQKLVGVIVPDPAEIRRRGSRDIVEAVRQAVKEQSGKLPTYQRLDEYAVSRDALPRTRLGKIRRHLLPERYRHAKQEGEKPGGGRPGPLALSEMSDHDRALLDEPIARLVWEWLANRYPEVRLTPDTSPHLDLGVDSMEWLNLTMEIGQRTGVELPEEAIGRVDTVRDLLQEVSGQAASGGGLSPERAVEEPEQVLDQQQQRWLAPLNPFQLLLARGLYLLNRVAMRVCFRLRVEGLERLPEGQFVLTPNHVSVLDPFIIAAALPFARLRQTYYAGWTGMAFRNVFFRFVSRLAQTVPIDPKRAIVSSLGLGAAVLQRKRNLIWFPEGERSRNGELQQFKPGIGILLFRYPAPVVPAFIQGAYEALPRGTVRPRFTKITLAFGRPLDPRQLAAGSPEDQVADRISRELQKAVAALGNAEADSLSPGGRGRG